MNLLNLDIETELVQKSLYAAYEEGSNAKVIAKFYNPFGEEKWFITGGDKLPNGDWMLYGLSYIQHWEIGTYLLSVLETLESNYTIKIERDLQYNGDETLDEAYRKSCRNTDDIDLINNFGGNKNGK
jgi:hypothetical protein